MAVSGSWRQSGQSKYSSRSTGYDKQRPSSSADSYNRPSNKPNRFQPLDKVDPRITTPGKFNLQANGDLCLDDMRRRPALVGAFIDPLTAVWSVNEAELLKYMNYYGIDSLEHSKLIVSAMKNFKHWEGGHLFLDEGEIFDEPAKEGQYQFVDESLHFYSNKSERLVEVARYAYYRHINVGVYYPGMAAQPNLSKDSELPLSYINRKKNYMFLGRAVDQSMVPYFAMDDEASYSVSDGARANQMTDLLKKFIKPGGMVIDMTACVGGNTIAFADSYFVRAQEIDALRYTLLRYNCMVAGVPLNRYLVWCVDSIELFNTPGAYTSDCIYCDPPWGGTEYGEEEEMELELGPMNLVEIALRSLEQTKVFMCRTTFNYNRHKFNDEMEQNGYQVITYVTHKQKDQSRPLFYLLFVVKAGYRYDDPGFRVPSLFSYVGE